MHLNKLIEQLTKRKIELGLAADNETVELLTTTVDKLEDVKMIIGELFLNARDSHNSKMNQHNPYYWYEVNPKLFKKLESYLGNDHGNT